MVAMAKQSLLSLDKGSESSDDDDRCQLLRASTRDTKHLPTFALTPWSLSDRERLGKDHFTTLLGGEYTPSQCKAPSPARSLSQDAAGPP